MAITSADVAKAAGVSRPAVSQILNGRGRFSAETIRRVESAAAALHYKPSVAARALATGKSDIVIAVVPHTTYGTNLQDLADVLTREFATAGLTLVLHFSSAPVALFREFIAKMQPRSVIAPFGPMPAAERQALHASGTSIVELFSGEHPSDPNYQIGRIQAEHFLAKGFQNFAYAHLQDDRLNVFGDAREKGFVDALRAAGTAAPRSIRIPLDLDKAIRALRGLPDEVAVACYNDDVAIALVSAARELQRPIPTSLAVIGMDATSIGALLSPRLTTIALDTPAILNQLVPFILQRVCDPTAAAQLPLDALPFRVVPGAST